MICCVHERLFGMDICQIIVTCCENEVADSIRNQFEHPIILSNKDTQYYAHTRAVPEVNSKFEISNIVVSVSLVTLVLPIGHEIRMREYLCSISLLNLVVKDDY